MGLEDGLTEGGGIEDETGTLDIDIGTEVAVYAGTEDDIGVGIELSI
jgi:hypothetical protein